MINNCESDNLTVSNWFKLQQTSYFLLMFKKRAKICMSRAVLNQTLQYKKQQLTENLGGYVVGGTTEGRRQMLVINTLLTHPKICNSHVTLCVQQHIVQLQIPGGCCGDYCGGYCGETHCPASDPWWLLW